MTTTGAGSPQAGAAPRVLLATDGTSETDDAARVAIHQARRLGARLQVVAAADGAPPVNIGREIQWVSTDEAQTDEELAVGNRVRESLRTILGDAADWDLNVRRGVTADVIADAARESGADIIVMGRGKPRGLVRMMGEELTLQVVRQASTPVLAVRAGGAAIAHTAVAAVDFSAASIVAARAASRLLEPGPDGRRRLILLHVPIRGDDELDASTLRQFARLESMLAAGQPSAGAAPLAIERHITTGNVHGAIQALVAAEDAQIVALGTHGRGFLERLFVGSAAISMLRDADVSVLISPAPDPVNRIRLELDLWEHVTLDQPAEWRAATDMLAAEHIGRLARLVSQERGTGQTTEHVKRGVLRAVTWNADDRCIDLRFSDPDNPDQVRHCELIQVMSVELQQGDGPHEQSVRVRDAHGESLLTFVN